MAEHTAIRTRLMHISERASFLAGHSLAFIVVAGASILWIGVGKLMQFSNTWQMITSDGSSLITILLVFLLQNSENRQTKAFQLKLDEIIRATEGAKNSMVSLEKLSDDDLEDLSLQYHEFAEQARKRIRKPKEDLSKT